MTVSFGCFSALRPLKRPLGVLRLLGGFPLSPVDPQCQGWVLVKRIRVWGWLLAAFLIGFYIVCNINMLLSEDPSKTISFSSFKTIFYKFGLTYTDCIVILSIYLVANVSALHFAKTVNYPSLATDLSDICGQTSVIGRDLMMDDSVLNQTSRQSMLKLLPIVLINVLMIGLNSYSSNMLVPEMSLGARLPITIAAILLWLFCLFPLSQVSLHLITGQLFGVFDLQLQRYARLLLQRKTESTKMQLEEKLFYMDINQVERVGFWLSDLVSSSATSLSHFLFWSLAICHLYQVVGLFGAIPMLTAITADQFMVVAFTFGAQNLLLALSGFLRASHLYSLGQNLSVSFLRVRHSLELYFVRNQHRLSEERINTLRVLIDRFDSTSAPVRPKDTIDLNQNTHLTAMGIIMTYMVVLFQFKVGEKPN